MLSEGNECLRTFTLLTSEYRERRPLRLYTLQTLWRDSLEPRLR